MKRLSHLLLGGLLLAFSGCTEQYVERRSGPWEVVRRGEWSWRDHRRIYEHLLYRRLGASRTLVARNVKGYDLYPDDCIIFHAHTPPEPPGFYAGCGSRQLLRVSGPSDEWRIMGEELQVPGGWQGNTRIIKQRRPVSDVLREAKLQPPAGTNDGR